MNESVFTQAKDALYNLIRNSSDVGIILGEKQNVDKMAASLSLFLVLKGIDKNVQIISKRLPTVELSNLVGVDKVKNRFEGNIKTLVVSIPYKDGEIEKVSYNTEGDKLNINLFATKNGIQSFNENDIRFIKKGSSPSLIFTFGIDSLAEISDLVDASVTPSIVNVDNSFTNSLFGDVVLVDPSFSSVSEIIAKLVEDLSLPMDIDISQNLLDGISVATLNFASPQTTIFAFQSAAFLLKNGARRKVREQSLQRPIIKKPFQPIDRQRQPFPNASQSRNEVRQAGQDENVPSDWFQPKVFKSKRQD